MLDIKKNACGKPETPYVGLGDTSTVSTYQQSFVSVDTWYYTISVRKKVLYKYIYIYIYISISWPLLFIPSWTLAIESLWCRFCHSQSQRQSGSSVAWAQEKISCKGPRRDQQQGQYNWYIIHYSMPHTSKHVISYMYIRYEMLNIWYDMLSSSSYRLLTIDLTSVQKSRFVSSMCWFCLVLFCFF